RPEFLNRVDELIVFKSLTQEQLGAIVDIQLARLQKRLDERKITLIVSDAARRMLIERGWDPVYGARPLKRAIQRMVQDSLAMQLLAGKFVDGDVIEVDVNSGELVFEKAKARAAEPVAQLEQIVPAGGTVRSIKYASSAACAHRLASYDVWPLPRPVSKTEPAICRLTYCASAYGVAGSLVPPTSRIGGVPLTVSDSWPCFGLTGQYAHCRFEYWSHGRKNGEA